MFKRESLKTVSVISMTAMMLVAGCNSERGTTIQSEDEYPQAVAPTDYNEPLIKQTLLLEESADKELALEANMSLLDVSTGCAWIESQGYVFTDSNSFALIEEEYHLAANDPEVAVGTEPAAAKRTPDIQPSSRLVRADSLVWLAFENPTHDMANHTAIITAYQGGQTRTMFVELNIGSEPPSLIRGGLIVNGQLIPDGNGEEHLESWWACMLIGAETTTVGCIFTNCGYGACAAAGLTVTLVGCTLSWAFSL